MTYIKIFCRDCGKWWKADKKDGTDSDNRYCPNCKKPMSEEHWNEVVNGFENYHTMNNKLLIEGNAQFQVDFISDNIIGSKEN